MSADTRSAESVPGEVADALRASPRRWLVTGVAGFIGSHLLEALLALDQAVVGLDDFSTGRRANLADVEERVGPAWARFTLVEGDVADPEACRAACADVDVILHQAALGSVPRSIERPADTHAANATGTLRLLEAAAARGVRRFVHASSSSVYGDDPGLPKVEDRTGRALSPYAASKASAERYAEAFAAVHGLEVVGLRYFNVFGPRQDPAGPYAAVIPRWVRELLEGGTPTIFGDGETTRDFCYVANAVQANLRAATVEREDAFGAAYNVAVGERTSLNELFAMIRDRLARSEPRVADVRPVHADFRPGDVRHSLADVSRARERLGYEPTHGLAEGLDEALPWYARQAADAASGTDPAAGQT